MDRIIMNIEKKHEENKQMRLKKFREDLKELLGEKNMSQEQWVEQAKKIVEDSLKVAELAQIQPYFALYCAHINSGLDEHNWNNWNWKYIQWIMERYCVHINSGLDEHNWNNWNNWKYIQWIMERHSEFKPVEANRRCSEYEGKFLEYLKQHVVEELSRR